jgi:hypothetical protein
MKKALSYVALSLPMGAWAQSTDPVWVPGSSSKGLPARSRSSDRSTMRPPPEWLRFTASPMRLSRL